MGINSILEATKVRQAREIRDLRRKLRESQLVLPPRTFKELQTTHKDPDGDGDRSDPPGAESSEEDGEIEDPVFNKLKLMIEGMVIRGLHAVESKHEVQGGSGVKVLSAAELEEYDPLRDSTRSLAPDELNLEDDDDCPGRDDEHLVGREQAVSERWARGDGSQRAVSPLLTITPVP